MTNTPNQPLYLYSDEAPRSGLPAQCEVVRFLAVGDLEAKAAVIRTVAPAYPRQISEFVVLAKGHARINEAYTGNVAVYVMEVDERANITTLDLSRGLQPVLDWGSLTGSKEAALRNQVR